MVELTVLPDVIPPTVAWLNARPEVTALVADRIGTLLPADEAWPAVRLDLIGGLTIFEQRLDQPTIQVQCFATTDLQARTVARTVRAALFAMVGHRIPNLLSVVDVDTSSPQLLPDDSRTPTVAHATFTATITIRTDP